ncbi:MAG: hypothetical protein N2171_00165 [Clostridia bacterium]|nr:hypothetical protein [Clostridia bacterium]
MSLKKNEIDKGYMLVHIFMFYTFPLAFVFMKGEFGQNLSTMQLLALNPMVVFLSSVVCTVRSGFNWKHPIVVGGLFLPSIFIYYDANAVVYAVTYVVIAYAASFIGAVINKYIH